VAEFPLALQIPYVKYLLGLRETTSTAADHKRMVIHVARVGEELLRFLEASERAPNYGETLSAVASSLNFIPLYVSGENLLPAYRARAAILERYAALVGTALDGNFPRRPPLPGARFKVGFLSHHLGSQTETHVSLSNLRLDRKKFEIHAFVLASASSSIESFAREQCDSFTVLSGSIGQKVAALRGAQLDAVIYWHKRYAVTNDTSLLAAHRLARVQILSYCSPTSSGFGSVDYFLVGSHARFPELSSISRKSCWSCRGRRDASITLASLRGLSRSIVLLYGLGPDDLVFVNAASCFARLRPRRSTLGCLCSRKCRTRS
jgi:predicted O-linked N-acetylglucosamine transferase (SPINDLY family)